MAVKKNVFAGELVKIILCSGGDFLRHTKNLLLLKKSAMTLSERSLKKIEIVGIGKAQLTTKGME